MRECPGPPESEPPYDADAYAAWGRERFGEEWYQSRNTMLEERDIYRYDPVYKERQKALRVMEHKVERRPFEPGLRAGGIHDPGWKRLWARLSKDLGIEMHTSPTPSKGSGDSETDLSGYDTYDPTPEPREPTPLPDDPWERPEYDRKGFNYDEERYEFEKIFLNESLIDGARTRRENEPGDRQDRERREAMESYRYVDPVRFSLERRRFQDHIDLPKKGWTHEEINAMYDAEAAMDEWKRKNPAPKGSGEFHKPVTPDERAAEDSWTLTWNAAWIRIYRGLPPKGSGPFGFSATQEEEDASNIWYKNTHARLSGQQQREALPSPIGDASASEVAAQPRVSPRRTKSPLRQTRGGRIVKEAHTQALPPDRGRGPSNLDSNIRTEPQPRNRQRKTYKKERASRRLAGQLPEYGMLLGRGEAEPLYKVDKLSKRPAAVRSAKPGGVEV
ncbi:Uu.00g094020.m01.CDS01 [Anthostomella pinea]|uniref:Uu.00g094020.m01.CDS01 n=1 Tax=Anthostomella pinea TaxID=933095 RepID=A0AAI8VPI6_9PEZI|nr:Uu.00g094020.m01.CDS01 [Anthostomella pinea]